MLLSSLLAALPGASVRRENAEAEIDITALAADSRTVAPGALFVALPGEHADGGDFIAAAIAAGARAVVTERDIEAGRGVAVVRVADARVALSRLAACFFGEPSHALRVAGITGTNGKTTSVALCATILDACGIACGQIGTLGARFHEWSRPLGNTTPLPIELHETLARMRDLGAAAVAMEVSSHALALHRVDDVRFDVCALTNITRDHLDFHHSFNAYAAAKRRLFELARRGVLGIDDAVGARWAAELRTTGVRVTTYGFSPGADVSARDLRPAENGTAFTLSCNDGGHEEIAITLPLIGRFNVQNALCALAVARVLGCDLARGARALATVEAVSGRMERFAADGVVALVDYAHTPDALARVLQAARELTSGRVIAVFGCGGERDQGKRPEMGAVAAERADVIIVTNDNPRGEDPQTIARAIVAGAPHASVELDRRAAIRQAIAAAQAGDVVVVAGKGHEPYQIVGTSRHAFDDREEVRAALAQRGLAATARS
ncbi:MAG: UDP-N-acetylmuramoyl-L-alanyl-D-glutamate--2,6-diaminopimelate ligase [Candidatus Eremiobacteraeota bacterium]|nr:UDP-N-acetylmuramoyl-L-alanyl-D-glutamate--2,6-diaminopimelate ligase [Candidatus Eremiobacteraeota bacterium]